MVSLLKLSLSTLILTLSLSSGAQEARTAGSIVTVPSSAIDEPEEESLPAETPFESIEEEAAETENRSGNSKEQPTEPVERVVQDDVEETFEEEIVEPEIVDPEIVEPEIVEPEVIEGDSNDAAIYEDE